MHVLRYTMAARCIKGGMRPKTLQVCLENCVADYVVKI